MNWGYEILWKWGGKVVCWWGFEGGIRGWGECFGGGGVRLVGW